MATPNQISQTRFAKQLSVGSDSIQNTDSSEILRSRAQRNAISNTSCCSSQLGTDIDFSVYKLYGSQRSGIVGQISVHQTHVADIHAMLALMMQQMQKAAERCEGEN